jgi:putative membrane protein
MIAKIFIAFIAALHIYILVLEMFLWDKPLGLRVFGNSVEKAVLTKVLAKNQGLYNGFLAAGLIWSIFSSNIMFVSLATFFLSCVFIAGIYGAWTVSRKILLIQAIPAFIALICVHLNF